MFLWTLNSFASVSQFSCSVMSDSLQPHGLQHTRPPCPSPTPGVYPNSCPLSRWCHPAISSSVIPFSSCPQSLPALGSFPMSQFFTSGCHRSIVEFQLQHQSFQWIFRTDFLYNGLVGSPCSPRDSQESSPTPQFKSISSSVLSLFYGPTFTYMHHYWKTIALTIQSFVGKGHLVPCLVPSVASCIWVSQEAD